MRLETSASESGEKDVNECMFAGKMCLTVCVIYIYISGVKISELKQEIIFSQIKVLKIFNAINAGAGLGLATPFATAASVSFFLKRIAFI